MTFDEYQIEATKTDIQGGIDKEGILVPLLGLAGEVGSLLTLYKKWLRDGDPSQFARQRFGTGLHLAAPFCRESAATQPLRPILAVVREYPPCLCHLVYQFSWLRFDIRQKSSRFPPEVYSPRKRRIR